MQIWIAELTNRLVFRFLKRRRPATRARRRRTLIWRNTRQFEQITLRFRYRMQLPWYKGTVGGRARVLETLRLERIKSRLITERTRTARNGGRKRRAGRNSTRRAIIPVSSGSRTRTVISRVRLCRNHSLFQVQRVVEETNQTESRR